MKVIALICVLIISQKVMANPPATGVDSTTVTASTKTATLGTVNEANKAALENSIKGLYSGFTTLNPSADTTFNQTFFSGGDDSEAVNNYTKSLLETNIDSTHFAVTLRVTGATFNAALSSTSLAASTGPGGANSSKGISCIMKSYPSATATTPDLQQKIWIVWKANQENASFADYQITPNDVLNSVLFVKNKSGTAAWSAESLHRYSYGLVGTYNQLQAMIIGKVASTTEGVPTASTTVQLRLGIAKTNDGHYIVERYSKVAATTLLKGTFAQSTHNGSTDWDCVAGNSKYAN